MYRKILIPTDGSPLADLAAKAGVVFACEVGAAVVGFTCAATYRYPMNFDGHPYAWPSASEYTEMMSGRMNWDLHVVRNPAEAAGLPFEAVTVLSDHPAEEIVATAERLDCDLIFMGSHGRSGIKRLLLGSVASKVLALSHIPVTIYRPTEEETERLASDPAQLSAGPL